MTHFVRTLILVVVVQLSRRQVLADQLDSCSCKSTFDMMVTKLKSNYIGYYLTGADTSKALTAHFKQFSQIAERTERSACASVLQECLEFFGDKHTFVFESPHYNETQMNQSKQGVQGKKLDLADVYHHLVNARRKLDPIEGLWTDGASKFAIVRNVSPRDQYQYLAVILSDTATEKKGEIKWEASLHKDKYVGTYYSRAYVPRYVAVTLLNDNSQLSIWGGLRWGRIAYSDSVSIDTMPLYRAELPRFKSIDYDAVVVTLPSFLIDKQEFDAFMSSYKDSLRLATNLIIDLRGNTGGNGIYFDLLEYYYDRPSVSERGLALSSADNIEYFSRFISHDANDPYAKVVRDMKEFPGKIVAGPYFKDTPTEPMETKIRRVAIITDRFCVSAAEAFILYSKAVSARVTTYGENTGGCIDYCNIYMVQIGRADNGMSFGYPTYTLNERIATEGYNKEGIPPDVSISSGVTDKVAYVHGLMRK